ncbi:MAG TPA: ABC transporter permease [Candidatus Melainabacteria bacterium]|nr:ABC transporter permease [Candidatus Melainabacteria bacterium]
MGHEILTLMRKDIIETIREFKSLGLFIMFCAIFFPMFSLFGNTEISAALIEDQLSNQRGKVGVRGDVELVRDLLKEKKELDVSPLFDMDPIKAVEDDVYDITVVMPETEKASQSNTPSTSAADKPTIDVFYDSHSEGTITWAVEVAAAMSSSQMKMLRTKLTKVGVQAYPDAVPKVSYKGIADVERKGAAPLSETLPTVILFFVTTVAIGGAIGGITMERENKRLAQLLLLPIKRSSILYSLLLVVSGISLLPVLAGLFSLSWAFSLDEIADRLKMHNLVVTVPPETVLWLMLLTVPIAISVTATSILFSCYYRVAQQARGYSLIYMVVLNGIVRYIITLKSLEGVMLFIPIVNSVYVMQRALDGKADTQEISLATIITLATSVWMIQIGAKKLSDEKLLLGVERAPKRQLFFCAKPSENL